MQKQIKTSIDTPFLHICKRNGGYYGICTNSEFEPKSVAFFKFSIGKPEIIQNDYKKEFEEFRAAFFEEQNKYNYYYKARCENGIIYEYDEEEMKKNIDILTYQNMMKGFDSRMTSEEIMQKAKRMSIKSTKYPDLNEEVDKIFAVLKDRYEGAKQLFDKMEQMIQKINYANAQKQNIEKINKDLNIVVNKKFMEYMEKNNLPFAKDDHYCARCDVYVTRSGKSSHEKTYMHRNREEYEKNIIAQTTKVTCSCGSKILPKNMERHLESDKHNGIGQEKVMCPCGVAFFPKFADRHRRSKDHMDFENNKRVEDFYNK